MYDPVIGRFISADDLVPDWFDPQALNRYTYVLNNPLKYEDPDGHFFVIFGFVLAGAIIYEWIKPDPANAPENYEQAQNAQKSSTGVSNAITGGLIGLSAGTAAVEGGVGKALVEATKEVVSDTTGLPTDIGDLGKVTGNITKVADDFFENTKFTDKVLKQMELEDFHGFPKSVEGFQSSGKVTKIVGNDGVTREMLEIPGNYKGKEGVFQYIKEPNGAINHRYFQPNTGN